MTLDPTIAPSIDENARRRFEADWRPGRPDRIGLFLPPESDLRYLATLEELVQIDLEFAWKQRGRSPDGPRPPLVEDYLKPYPGLNHPAVLGRLLRQEYIVRHHHGDRPAAAEYNRRFPDLSFDWGDTKVPDRPSAYDGLPRPAGYDVLKSIGAGGMGVVYEARQAGLDRVVAIKTIRGPANEEDRGRFLAEARIAARLEHPGVVPVHDLATPPDGPPYYTMKLVRGRTLEEAIQQFHKDGQTALDRQRLLTAFLAVTRTMAFAHSRGVIHRDLKPANVVLGDFGETVILDWGLAKVLKDDGGEAPRDRAAVAGPADLTVQGSIMGTPAYMAPEQAAGRIDELDERSDVYALGCVLFQILTGRVPFIGDSNDVLRQVIQAEPVRPRALNSAVPRPLEAICLRALAKRPADRYPSAADLAADLESYLAGEPVKAYAERPSERLRRWARRRRTLVASAGVALALLFAGGIVGLFSWQSFANERDKQKSDFDRKRRQEAAEKRQARANTARELAVLADAELRADRFGEAEKVLHKAVTGLRGEPELADLRAELEERRVRVWHLAEFYRLWGRAEGLAGSGTEITFSKVDADTLSSCEAALKHVGVAPGDGEWWNRLPGTDLEARQRARLETDVSMAQTLAALWCVKQGVLQFNSNSFRKARTYLEQVKAYGTLRGEPSRTVEVVEVFCRFLLGEPQPPARQPAPRTAADAYFIGITHVFLTDTSERGLARRVYRLVPRSVWDRTGLDFETPQDTAERMLRTATALDPQHFWAHFWLGTCLTMGNNQTGAEQAFDACVALRPDYVYGYTWRALALIQEIERLERAKAQGWTGALTDRPEYAWLMTATTPPGPTLLPHLALGAAAGKQEAQRNAAARIQADLKRRAQRGLIDGLLHHPHSAFMQGTWGRFLGVQQRWAPALEAYALAAEFEAAQRLLDPRSDPVEGQPALNAVQQFLSGWFNQDPKNADVRTALAGAQLAENRDDDALKLLADLGGPRVYAVRGAVAYRHKDYAKAAAEFAEALAAPPAPIPVFDDPEEAKLTVHRPGWSLAALGRARSLEQLGKADEAARAFDNLLAEAARPRTVATWQQLEAHLGRARLLAGLGRAEEARRALEDARQIDPAAADELAAKLFPQDAQ